jgi:hypothetical protein
MPEHIILHGQDRWIEPNRPLPRAVVPTNLLQRLVGLKPYRADYRLEPNRRIGLDELAEAVKVAFGIEAPTPERHLGDRAVWVVGYTYGRSPKHAAARAMEWFIPKLQDANLDKVLKSLALKVTR